MNMSFYSAAASANAQQSRLDVVANNLANANTVGFKAKSGTFSDLIYNNIMGPAGDDSRIKRGSGSTLEKTPTSFEKGSLMDTMSKLDFSIDERGFFGLRDPQTQEMYYTTNGNFVMSQRGDQFYLVSKEGYNVIGKNNQPITLTDPNDETLMPAVFDFPYTEGLVNVGGTNFQPVEKSGAAVMIDANVRQASLEGSNVNLSREMTKVIESQRAYQLSLRMIQTTDEIQNTINTLR